MGKLTSAFNWMPLMSGFQCGRNCATKKSRPLPAFLSFLIGAHSRGLIHSLCQAFPLPRQPQFPALHAVVVAFSQRQLRFGQRNSGAGGSTTQERSPQTQFPRQSATDRPMYSDSASTQRSPAQFSIAPKEGNAELKCLRLFYSAAKAHNCFMFFGRRSSSSCERLCESHLPILLLYEARWVIHVLIYKFLQVVGQKTTESTNSYFSRMQLFSKISNQCFNYSLVTLTSVLTVVE